MKCKLITTVSDPTHIGWLTLKYSLDKFGWDYEICGTEYHQFGSKMVNAYNYALQTDCSHLFIVDAYDVVVLGTMEEALGKIDKLHPNLCNFWCVLFGAEINAWPYEQWSLLYPDAISRFKYLNGGLAFVEVEKFIKMFEDNPIQSQSNDQVILAKTFLTNNRYCMYLDTNCQVFQNLCGTNWEDFEFENGRVRNKETGAMPVLIHGNGRAPMDKIVELI